MRGVAQTRLLHHTHDWHTNADGCRDFWLGIYRHSFKDHLILASFAGLTTSSSVLFTVHHHHLLARGGGSSLIVGWHHHLLLLLQWHAALILHHHLLLHIHLLLLLVLVKCRIRCTSCHACSASHRSHRHHIVAAHIWIAFLITKARSLIQVAAQSRLLEGRVDPACRLRPILIH